MEIESINIYIIYNFVNKYIICTVFIIYIRLID
jgi:hypothetical protein